MPWAPLAGLAVLLVLGLVFGLAFLRQPGSTGEAALNLTSKPVPEAAVPTTTATPTATPTTKKAAARKPVAKKPATTTTTAAPRRSVPVRTTTATHKPKPKPKKTTTAPSTGGGSIATQVLSLTNAERAKAGCGALTISSALTKAAQDHSADMAANNYFSHDSQNGKNPFDRMTDAGYTWGAAAENIAMGQPTPAAVMDAWMNSPGHKANILNCTYTNIGIGYAIGNGSPYWTQDFGKPL